VIGGRLAALQIERSGFEKYIGARLFQPLCHILRSSSRGARRRPVPVQQRDRIQPIGIGNPAGSPRSYTGQPPTHIVPAAQLRFFGDQQSEKCAANISNTYDG
jgi:hypothetical protein